MNESEVEKYESELREKNQKHRYFLNYDKEFALGLVESLMTNSDRYGYESCPCRLATGKRQEDIDIICPCYYRDSDIVDFGACFCGLYVSKYIFNSKGQIKPIKERRPNIEERRAMSNKNFPVWRCNVCGYLCSRDDAPDVCPICGADHDRFAETKLGAS
jgi:ferredoxin-thioredoxin reductase catalytic subunit